MIKSFAKSLTKYGKRIFSQTIEDGIIEEIFNNIGTTNRYFVEFGAWDGIHLSNTANLRINKKWTGLLLEGDPEKAKIPHIKHAIVTPENVNNLFEKYKVPKKFDLLSIDIDGNDFWVWKAIKGFDARVVIIEYNSNFEDCYKSVTIKCNAKTNLNYYGATIAALKKLGESKGYCLIYRVKEQNLIFIKRKLLHEDDQDIELKYFVNKNGKAERRIETSSPDKSKNMYNLDENLFYDCFSGENTHPHWSPYANTNITTTWDQDLSREWVAI